MDTGTFVLASSADAATGARARAFRHARRHSRHVWALRRALEISVVGAIVLFATIALYRTFGRALPGVSFEGIGIEGGRITMDRPRLTGARPGGGGYAITAIKAMQDAQHPGDIDLALIGGDITMPDREVSRLSADSGRYEGEGETLDLSGDVRMTNSRYEIFLRSVHIEFKKGDYVSKEPVTVHILPDATITADSFLARDGGAEVRFQGRVRTLIKGTSPNGAPQSATP
jgi:lipopolysaccharide export system protein LptC